jgi:hypothetical protein
MRATTIILVLFLFSCGHRLTEQHYKSTDNLTGGFNDFSLDLYSDGKLVLTVTTSVNTQESYSGVIRETFTKKVNGKWSIKNNRINYVLYTPKSSVDSIFLNSDFNELMSRQLIEFNQNRDTVWIYGIPCPQTTNY